MLPTSGARIFGPLLERPTVPNPNKKEALMSREPSIVEERQKPLRALYSRQPEEAITIKRVRSVQGPETDCLHGSVIPVGYPGIAWRYGTDRKVGGYDDLPNSGHLLVGSLATCMDSITRMIADLLRVRIVDLQVEVEGDVDVRGTMAIDPTVRPGFRGIRSEVHLRVAPGTPDRLIEILTAHAEKLSVCLDTLRNGTPVDVEFDVRSQEPASTSS
jgi:uncharacterized OsmC-like protein